jgi:peptidyl-prolyl cis-trans isomerase B (cyclophilin B)
MAQQREAARKRNIVTAAVAAVAVVAIGIGVAVLSGGTKNTPVPAAATPTPTTPTSGASTPSTTPSSAPKIPIDGCTTPPAGLKANTSLSWKTEPAMTIDPKKKYTMTITTNCGDIVIDMDAAKAPETVNSFNFLAGQKYFDGSYCHRLSTTAGLLMLQCGDPTKNPANAGAGDGPGPGYTFKDENLTGATYPAGTVAMANSGKDTNGSQFFLVFGDTQLSPDYTPWGKITNGLDILTKVAGAGVSNPSPSDGTGFPNQPVMLEKVTVTAG